MNIVQALLRRWRWTLALAVSAVAVAVAVLAVVPPSFQARASVVLVPPGSKEDPTGNRLLLLSGLNPGRDVLLNSMTSSRTRESLLRDLPGADYTLEPDFTTSAPLVLVTSDGPTAEQSEELLKRILTALPTSLRTLQVDLGTRQGTYITSEVVSQERALRTGKKQVRAVLAASGLWTVGGIFMIVLLDSGRLRRRSPGSSAVAESGSSAATPFRRRPPSPPPPGTSGPTSAPPRRRRPVIETDGAGPESRSG